MQWANGSGVSAADGVNNTSAIGPYLGMLSQPLYSDQVLIAFTLAYVAIFLVGLCGNVFTCLVVIRRHYVHSQTPFYLNLAFSDLLLLSGLPADVYFFWHPYGSLGGSWFCVFRAIITESATNASILTIVIFTADRWTSICHPAKSATNFPTTHPAGGRFWNGKNGQFVVAIWLTAVVAATPLSAQLGLVPLIDSGTGLPMEDASVCHVVPERAIPYSFEASSLVFFVLPMILITLFYWSIIIELRRTVATQASVNDSPLMHEARGARQQAKASGAVVKILIAVVVAFFICFSPHHLQRLLATYISTKGNAFWASFSQLLFTISGLSYYISTAVNPVIYCLLSKRFRFALQTLITCRRKRNKTARNHFSNDLMLLNKLNGRALAMKANTGSNYPQRYKALGSGPAGRYPLSCPLARKPSASQVQRPGKYVNEAPRRPRTLPVSSPRARSPTTVSSSSCNSTNHKPVGGTVKWHWDAREDRQRAHEQCQYSDCYNVYYVGDKLVISFVSLNQSKEGINSI